MPYAGPSRGCQICKDRHMKCDGARPHCQNCMRRNFECPGYRDDFDIILKDETASTAERSRRKGTAARKPRGVPSQSPLSLRLLREDREGGCLCFFFDNYLALTQIQDPMTHQGFLNLVLPLYSRVEHDSPLSLATTALAINMTSMWSGQGREPPLARTYFGKALASTRSAIKDAEQNTADETLLAVLLLEFYEAVSGSLSAEKSSGAHRSGAVALIEHRGHLNFHTETAKRLLLAVRHELIQKAIDSGEGMAYNPVFWTEDATLPLNPAWQLDVLVAEVANLHSLADTFRYDAAVSSPSMSSRTPSPDRFTASTDQQHVLHSLLSPGMHLDARLFRWTKSLPDDWLPTRVSTSNCIPTTVAAAGFYSDNCDIYSSLHIASIWNAYRTARLAILKVILRCQWTLLCAPEDTENILSPTKLTLDTIQDLADAICASVPSHLGNRTEALPRELLGDVEYPMFPPEAEQMALPNSKSRLAWEEHRRQHHRVAASMGVWYLLSPLKDMLKVATSTERDNDLGLPPLLREGQIDWVRGQLLRMKKISTVRL